MAKTSCDRMLVIQVLHTPFMTSVQTSENAECAPVGATRLRSNIFFMMDDVRAEI